MKGLGGQAYFQNLVINEWGWLYHQNEQENDYGVDAYIEIVDSGNVTGKLIGVQIKYGNSYFSNRRNKRILYHGELKHINYYQNSDVPIILLILSDNFSEIYWVKFDIDLILPTEKGWDIEIPCRALKKEDIKNIAGPIINFNDEVRRIKLIHNLIISAEYFLVIIPREDIENFIYTKIELIILIFYQKAAEY